MNPEVWAIIGVVVGAILGGVGQVVADTVRHRRDGAQRRQTLRREAYVEFLASVEGVYSQALGFIDEARMQITDTLPDEVPFDPSKAEHMSAVGRHVASRLGPVSEPLSLAVSKIQMVGPDSVADLAGELERFTWTNFLQLAITRDSDDVDVNADEEGKFEEYNQRVSAFVVEARRHVGLV